MAPPLDTTSFMWSSANAWAGKGGKRDTVGRVVMRPPIRWPSKLMPLFNGSDSRDMHGRAERRAHKGPSIERNGEGDHSCQDTFTIQRYDGGAHLADGCRHTLAVGV